MQSINCLEFEMRDTGKSSIDVERQCMIAMRVVSASVSAFAMTVAYWIASSSGARWGWFMAMCLSMVLKRRV